MGNVDYRNFECYKIGAEDLTLKNVPATRRAMFSYIDENGVSSLRVDMNEVEEMGCAGVALLVRVKRRVNYLVFDNVSEGVRNRIDVSKLSRLLLGE